MMMFAIVFMTIAGGQLRQWQLPQVPHTIHWHLGVIQLYKRGGHGGGTVFLRIEEDEGVAIKTFSLQLPWWWHPWPRGNFSTGIKEVGGRVPPWEGQGVQQRRSTCRPWDVQSTRTGQWPDCWPHQFSPGGGGAGGGLSGHNPIATPLLSSVSHCRGALLASQFLCALGGRAATPMATPQLPGGGKQRQRGGRVSTAVVSSGGGEKEWPWQWQAFCGNARAAVVQCLHSDVVGAGAAQRACCRVGGLVVGSDDGGGGVP